MSVKDRIHYTIGKFSTKYRLWYHTTHNNSYLWGILQAAKEINMKTKKRALNVKVSFAWFDLWIGFYYDRTFKKLYFCPIPTVIFMFWFD